MISFTFKSYRYNSQKKFALDYCNIDLKHFKKIFFYDNVKQRKIDYNELNAYKAD